MIIILLTSFLLNAILVYMWVKERDWRQDMEMELESVEQELRIEKCKRIDEIITKLGEK